MGRLPSSEDTQFWKVATWSLAGCFVTQFLLAIIASQLIDSDSSSMNFIAMLTGTGAETVFAALLWWKARGPWRGISLAAVTTATIWIVVLIIVALINAANR